MYLSVLSCTSRGREKEGKRKKEKKGNAGLQLYTRLLY